MKIIFETENHTLVKHVGDFVQKWQDSSPTITVHTSGSTGVPKKITLSKSCMSESARMTGEFLQLKSGDSALLCLSMDSIAGMMMIVRSNVLNLNLIVVDVNSNPLENISTPIDFAAMVPFQVEKALNKSKKKLLEIKKLIIGGGILDSEIEQQLHAGNNEIYQTFGMTETISHVAMRNIKEKKEVYTALPHVDFYSESDCLGINAPNLGVHKLITNDVIELIDKHNFRWIGRKDFVINSGGVKIHPEVVEKEYAGLINHEYFVHGLADKSLGSKLILCIESTHNEEIKKEMFSYLSNSYYVPKEVYFFNSFIYTDSGKINRPDTIKLIADAEKQIL